MDKTINRTDYRSNGKRVYGESSSGLFSQQKMATQQSGTIQGVQLSLFLWSPEQAWNMMAEYERLVKEGRPKGEVTFVEAKSNDVDTHGIMIIDEFSQDVSEESAGDSPC